MPATREQIRVALNSPDFTPGEKSVIKWQFHLHGDFKTALWDAIKRADENNLDRLAMGFPLEVEAFRAWAWGNLAGRIRASGLNI